MFHFQCFSGIIYKYTQQGTLKLAVVSAKHYFRTLKYNDIIDRLFEVLSLDYQKSFDVDGSGDWGRGEGATKHRLLTFMSLGTIQAEKKMKISQ